MHALIPYFRNSGDFEAVNTALALITGNIGAAGAAALGFIS